MIRKILLALLLAAIYNMALAAQIQLTINGKQKVVNFDPNDKRDVEKAMDWWWKADGKSFYIYSDIGGFMVCNHPIEDNSCHRVGNWSKELSTKDPQNPQFIEMGIDSQKWWPWDYGLKTQWIKMDDPHIVWPKQMQPIIHWPIRYYTYYVENETLEEEVKYKYDNYRRFQFDQEGFLLNNQTMKRYTRISKSTGKEIMYRMFGYKDFVTLDVVFADQPEKSFYGDAGDDLALTFSLSEKLKEPKLKYYDPGQDMPGDEIFAWASFDDPVTPLYDKKHGNVCVMDCKNRKRWAPFPYDSRY